ncbi:MAG TPA: hypothetical protein VFE94_01385 [Candidatus Paceibacterota bacterium]|nr:hypothetical protein [Candidatus Paceibacterota bacterium]
MQSYKLPILISLFFVGAVTLLFGFMSVFQKESGPQPSEPTLQDDQEPVVQDPSLLQNALPQFPEGTFSDSELIEDISISIQQAENKSSTARLAWDEARFRVFAVSLFDGDKIERRENDDILLWFISSFRGLPEDGQPVQRQDVTGFLSSGYVIGEGRAGFDYLEAPEEFQPYTLELESGTTYYLKMVGFGGDNDANITVNKIFTFTDSCLPPNCE